MLRVFIALDLPAILRGELQAVSLRLQRSLAGAPLRWVAPESMHLTLQFLGDIDQAQMNEIELRLRGLTTGFTAFNVRLAELGVFPNLRRPRILWAGLQAPASLAELQRAVEAEMVELGFAPEDRPFTPHLTLARAHRDAQPAQLAGLATKLKAEQLAPLAARLDELVVFRSQLNRGGAVYNHLVRIQLNEK
jgi:2'-5' RNA ligase